MLGSQICEILCFSGIYTQLFRNIFCSCAICKDIITIDLKTIISFQSGEEGGGIDTITPYDITEDSTVFSLSTRKNLVSIVSTISIVFDSSGGCHSGHCQGEHEHGAQQDRKKLFHNSFFLSSFSISK